MPLHLQPSYQPVKDFTCLPVLVSFNNCNVIPFEYKETSSEYIDKINHVAIDGISENMAALVLTSKYGTINTTDTTIMGYYVIKKLRILHTPRRNNL